MDDYTYIVSLFCEILEEIEPEIIIKNFLQILNGEIEKI